MGPVIDLPAAVLEMVTRGPEWATWVDGLPKLVQSQIDDWDLTPDGEPTNGYCSIVVPTRTADGTAAMLKVAFPDDESEHEHLALRRWAGDGTVRLLSADPHRRAMLLERLSTRNLNELWDIEACEIVASLYRRIHVPALPQLRTLTGSIEQWTSQLAELPRSAPIPRRLVEQAITLGRDFVADPASTSTLR